MWNARVYITLFFFVFFFCSWHLTKADTWYRFMKWQVHRAMDFHGMYRMIKEATCTTCIPSAMIESQLAKKQMKMRLKMSWEKGSACAATGQKKKKKRFVAVAWRSTAHYGRRVFVCNKQRKGSVKSRRKCLACLRSAVNHVKSCSLTLLPLPEPQRASSRWVWFWSPPPAVHRCPSGESNFSPNEAFRTLYPQTLNSRPGTVEHNSGD